MGSVSDGNLPRLLVFPGSLSSWRALIVAEELQVKVAVETINMFLWEHLKPEHLALSPRGTIPTLVLPTGRSLIGQVIYRMYACSWNSVSAFRSLNSISGVVVI